MTKIMVEMIKPENLQSSQLPLWYIRLLTALNVQSQLWVESCHHKPSLNRTFSPTQQAPAPVTLVTTTLLDFGERWKLTLARMVWFLL